MSAARPGLVDIAREFLAAHAMMRRLFAKHRAGSLRFQELEDLVGDDESSVLFRLKERCHASFRAAGGRQPMHREALFDLAVGSLFHEAMKFRENFYQREVYGPRVEALRSEAGELGAALFDEFARIQESVSVRLAEGLTETETLLARTLEQLVSLFIAHRDDPLVARFLVDNAAAVQETLGRPLAEVLAAIYGDTAAGYALAGRSLLSSGYYPEAIVALSAAAALRTDDRDMARLVAYARGMQAYLARDYRESVTRLSEWADAAERGGGELVGLAHDAVSRIGQLAEGADRQRVADAASALLVRLGRAGG